LAILSKKAVDAALKAQWQEAIDLNTQILDKNPENIDAKIRLGRALIQTRHFDKAKKIFREVLKIDPINAVALRNYDLAKREKAETKGQVQIDTRSLLKEPGTTAEINLELSAKGITARDFVSGENLLLKAKKKSIEILKLKNEVKMAVASIEDEDTAQRVNSAIEKSYRVYAGFLKGKDKSITILLKCSHPIFKAEKQDIRPYLRKGTLEEPEIEIETEEPTE